MSSKNKEIADSITSTKEHYKMYKSGKQWLFAGITVFTFGGMLAGGGKTAEAATDGNAGSNSTDPQTDATKQTNAPLEFSTTVTPSVSTASATQKSTVNVAASQAPTSQAAASQGSTSQVSAGNSVSSNTSLKQTATSQSSASQAPSQTATDQTVANQKAVSQTANSQATNSQPAASQNSNSQAPSTQNTASQSTSVAQSVTSETVPAKSTTAATAKTDKIDQNTSITAAQKSVASTAPSKQVTNLPNNATSQQVADAKSAALAAFAETGTLQEITRMAAATNSAQTDTTSATPSAAATLTPAQQSWSDYSKTLAAAKAEKAGNYTNASFSLLQTALTNASGMTQSAAKTALDSAQQQIQAAMDSLVPNLGAGGQAELQNTVSADQTKYANTSAAQYTTAAWKIYTDALSAANLGLSDAATTANTISVLYKKLTDATAGLEQNKSSVLFGQLGTTIASAADKLSDAGAYTVASIKTVQTAQTAAQQLRVTAAAQDIQTADQNLQTALAGLIPSGSLSSLQTTLNTTSVTYNANQTADNSKTNYAYAAYTKSSWDKFASAYVYAKAVMNNGAATPDQISTSSYNLQQAYQNLLTTDAANNLLSDAIAGGNQLLEENAGSAYGSDSTKALQDTISDAQKLLSSDGTPLATSTPDQLNQATQKIQAAIDSLTTTTNSAWNTLNTYINTADTLDAGDYTPGTFSTLTSAISTAKAALYDDSTAASLQSDANNLRGALWAATPANTTIATAKTALSAAVKSAETIAASAAQYSQDTYQTFANALSTAENLLDTASMDNVAMTKASANLIFYQNNLVNIGNNDGASFTGSYNTMKTLGFGGAPSGLGSFDTVTIVNGSTVTFGGASSFTGISVAPSYTSTWTLPISLAPFFKTTNWQKYVNLAYVLWSGT
ncbi:MAG TPA: hypothetical protein DCW31_01765, partial [Lactobacillus sp.]|nr:hypothetical protein [Lactobacillus sp.]